MDYKPAKWIVFSALHRESLFFSTVMRVVWLNWITTPKTKFLPRLLFLEVNHLTAEFFVFNCDEFAVSLNFALLQIFLNKSKFSQKKVNVVHRSQPYHAEKYLVSTRSEGQRGVYLSEKKLRTPPRKKCHGLTAIPTLRSL